MKKWLNIPKRAIVAGGIVLALVLGGVAYASIPGPDGVIHGCYKNSNPAQGSVLVVDSAASCPSGFTTLNWNQIGPQGAIGPQGPAGTSYNFKAQNTAGADIDVPAGAHNFLVEWSCVSGPDARPISAGFQNLTSGDVTGNSFPLNNSNPPVHVQDWRWQFNSVNGATVRLSLVCAEPV